MSSQVSGHTEVHGSEGATHRGHTSGPSPTRPASHDRHTGHSAAMLRDRFLVCAVLTLPILYSSDQVQQWFGIHPVVAGRSWLPLILSAVIYGYGGGIFLKGARDEWHTRTPGMMTLVALAISVAFFFSLAVTLGVPGMPFFWELATLIDVMLFGHWIEMLSIQGASRSLEHLAALIPPVAHRLVDTSTVDISVQELRAGDRILVRPGEQLPIDGIVEDGTSTLNEAFLTGESRPSPKQPGDEVIGGSVNGEGALTVRVTRTGEATTLSQIARLVEEAQASRSRFQSLADRAAYWLTLSAVGVGVVTFGVWLFAGQGLTVAVTRAVTVLVIACPHALGLAIPLVVVTATGLAAHHGILVRSREAFERAKDVRIVAFDKTGTLTEGRFDVRAVVADTLPVHEAIRLAASLEAMSEHPLGRAIVKEAQRQQLPLLESHEVRAIPGQGIEGEIGDHRYQLGRPEWASEKDLRWPDRLAAAVREAGARGEAVIVLMDSQQVLAVVTLADVVRDSARDAVRRLRAMGVDAVMVTGDTPAVAQTVAQEVFIARYYARVLPQDKAHVIAALRQEGPTAFVGDGINDAPALVEADVGIAIGAGTNIAIESADLVLVANDPLDVVTILQLSRVTYTKMIQNLLWATGYNVVAIPLAAGAASAWGVVLSPAVGAVLMSASTVIVAINAVLLRRVVLR